jgi:hypothetical protein
MAQTITEKILARASGRTNVQPGDYLTVRSNCPIIFGHHSFDTFMDRGLHMIPRLGVHIFDPAQLRISCAIPSSTACPWSSFAES